MCKKTNYKDSNVRIDKCMRPLIKFLESKEYKTVACCCGHDKYPMTIIVQCFDGQRFFIELLSNTRINRKRKFYKRDKEGYYYIPEVVS